MRDINAKEALNKITAAEFKRNNGIVMRAMSVAFPRRWFETWELKKVVQDRMNTEELQKTLVYLSDEGYLKYRHLSKKAATDIMDYELQDLEFRVTPKGTRLIECVEKNELIEM